MPLRGLIANTNCSEEPAEISYIWSNSSQKSTAKERKQAEEMCSNQEQMMDIRAVDICALDWEAQIGDLCFTHNGALHPMTWPPVIWPIGKRVNRCSASLDTRSRLSGDHLQNLIESMQSSKQRVAILKNLKYKHYVSFHTFLFFT